MEKEKTLILRCLTRFIGRAVSDDEIIALLQTGDFDWQYFRQMFSYHEYAAILYSQLKSYGKLIPEDVFQQLAHSYYYNIMTNQRRADEFIFLQREFYANNIDLIPIKGIAFNFNLYQDLPVRSMVDVDVLIRKTDLSAAEIIMNRLGYAKQLGGLKEKYWKKKQYHLEFSRNKKNFSLVEVHWALDYPKKYPVLTRIWDRIIECPVDREKIKMLSPEDDLFVLGLHNRRFGNMLNLKYGLDTVLILKKYKDKIDWDYVVKEAFRSRTRVVMFFLFSQAKHFFGGFIPESVFAGLKIKSATRKKILSLLQDYTFSPDLAKAGRELFLRCHFLFYDDLREPINYILNIPREQFAKFYKLSAYDQKTFFFYHFRLIFMGVTAVKILAARLKDKLALSRDFKTRAAYVKDYCYDFIFGVNTRNNSCNSLLPGSYQDNYPYQPVFYGRLARIFKLVKLNKDDVFIDLGCGKGRVVFCAAAGRVKQAIGIDVDEQLIAVARDNSRRARFSRAPVEFIHIDAVDFLCPDTATVFFLFNPFGEKTLAKVMENIKLSWQNNPRVIKIIYYAPACRKVLDQQDWLEFCWPVGDEHCLLWQSRLSASANNRKEILLNNQEIISLVKEVLAKQGVYEFAASGYSMCPFIKSQDSISLSAVKEEILEPGVIAGFVNPQGGQFTVHRIIAVKNGKFLFKGDNCFKPDGWVLDENILGYVCQIKRGLKIISIGLGIEKKAVAFLSRYTPLFPITMRIWKFFRNLF